jgi:hypothetical protein
VRRQPLPCRSTPSAESAADVCDGGALSTAWGCADAGHTDGVQCGGGGCNARCEEHGTVSAASDAEHGAETCGATDYGKACCCRLVVWFIALYATQRQVVALYGNNLHSSTRTLYCNTFPIDATIILHLYIHIPADASWHACNGDPWPPRQPRVLLPPPAGRVSGSCTGHSGGVYQRCRSHTVPWRESSVRVCLLQ